MGDASLCPLVMEQARRTPVSGRFLGDQSRRQMEIEFVGAHRAVHLACKNRPSRLNPTPRGEVREFFFECNFRRADGVLKVGQDSPDILYRNTNKGRWIGSCSASLSWLLFEEYRRVAAEPTGRP